MKRTTYRNVIVFSILIFMVTCFMSVGFSAIQKDITISGKVTYIPNTMLVNNSSQTKFLDCDNIASSEVVRLVFSSNSPSSFTKSCDVSFKQNSSVMAYINSAGTTTIAPVHSSDKIYFNTGTKFRNLTNCSSINFNHKIVTSNLRNMQYMFENLCSANNCSMTNLNLSDFNTSNVSSMYALFYGAKGVQAMDLSSFDTHKVIDMGVMFNHCESLTDLDISSFDTSNVCFMSQMFAYSSNLQSIYVSDLWTISRLLSAPEGGVCNYMNFRGSEMFYATSVHPPHSGSSYDCGNYGSHSYEYAYIDKPPTSFGCLTDVSEKPS